MAEVRRGQLCVVREEVADLLQAFGYSFRLFLGRFLVSHASFLRKRASNERRFF